MGGYFILIEIPGLKLQKMVIGDLRGVVQLRIGHSSLWPQCREITRGREIRDSGAQVEMGEIKFRRK